MSALLEVRDLGFAWPGQTPLFQDLNLSVGPGVSLVTGDEQCGKTTLLRLLAGEMVPKTGHLAFSGQTIDSACEAWHRQVFWIHPQTEVHDQICASDWFASLPARYPRFSRQALADLIEGFGLEPHLAKPMYMLSTGSKRKVWLSAAFAANAPLTLIDQPFAALDGPAIRFLRELLQDAADVPDRVWVIADFEAPADVPLSGTIAL
ncbi:ATP-binding cassette domain-containing protein [Hydrogenophaga sp. RWCD_12]|uniref:ABC transporter ATP-binding protein n=1 Tax=Hydrogenophaga sp. RWCD_12 TaxID=3391190 RepID=UPI003984E477